MAAAFGLHLGCSSSCLSVYKDGKTEVIANDAGDRTTPAIIAFTDRDKVVGLAAKQGLIRNAKNTVCHSGRILGLDFQHQIVQSELARSPVLIVERNGMPHYKVSYMESERFISPQDCATDIFVALQDIAKHHGDSDVHDVVCTAPHSYNSTQLNALKCAAEKAGFNVLRIINGPSAALLAYDIGQHNHHEPVCALVLRIGGTSCSVTCVTVTDGLYRILSNVDCDELGGDNFTEAIADHFSKEFQRLHKCDPKQNSRSWSKLKAAAESCKHTLTNLPNAQCTIDSLHEGIDFSATIARARVDILCSGLLSKCQQLIEEALTASGLDKSRISKVVLCGGSTKLTCITQRVQDILPNVEMLFSIPADEVLAVGAAKQAGILLAHKDSYIEPCEATPCAGKDIGVIVQGSEYEKIFSANIPVPHKTKRIFNCCHDSLRMVILQGSPEIKDIIAQVLLPDVGKGSEIEAHFALDSDGSLRLSCSEAKSGLKCDLHVPASQPA